MICIMEPKTAKQLAGDLKAVSHPTRLRILAHMVESTGNDAISPNGLVEPLGNGRHRESLGRVSYHVRQLLDARMIQLKRTEPRRGAVEHFYVPTKRGERVIALVTDELEE